MKRYEVKKDSRDFGKNCDWYNTNNMNEVNEMNPTRIVGHKVWPAAYFVEVVETVRDEMRNFNPVYTVHKAVAGPFGCEVTAREWVAAH